jgi:hypothetical protein
LPCKFNLGSNLCDVSPTLYEAQITIFLFSQAHHILQEKKMLSVPQFDQVATGSVTAVNEHQDQWGIQNHKTNTHL